MQIPKVIDDFYNERIENEFLEWVADLEAEDAIWVDALLEHQEKLIEENRGLNTLLKFVLPIILIGLGEIAILGIYICKMNW